MSLTIVQYYVWRRLGSPSPHPGGPPRFDTFVITILIDVILALWALAQVVP